MFPKKNHGSCLADSEAVGREDPGRRTKQWCPSKVQTWAPGHPAWAEVTRERGESEKALEGGGRGRGSGLTRDQRKGAPWEGAAGATWSKGVAGSCAGRCPTVGRSQAPPPEARASQRSLSMVMQLRPHLSQVQKEPCYHSCWRFGD